MHLEDTMWCILIGKNQYEQIEDIPLPDLSEQPENVQRPGSEVVEKGMLT